MANRSHIEFNSKMASTFFTFPMQYRPTNHAFSGAKHNIQESGDANVFLLLLRMRKGFLSEYLKQFAEEVKHIFE